MFHLAMCIAVMIFAKVFQPLARILSSSIADASIQCVVGLRARLTQREEPVRYQRLASLFSWTKQTTSLISLRPPDESPIIPNDMLSCYSDLGQFLSILLAAFGSRWLKPPFVLGIQTICLSISFLLAHADARLSGSVSRCAPSVPPWSSRIFSTTAIHHPPTSIPFRTSHQCNTSAAVYTTPNEVHWLSILSGLRSAYTAVITFTTTIPVLRAVITTVTEHWSTSQDVDSTNRSKGSAGSVFASLATIKRRALWSIRSVCIVGYTLEAHGITRAHRVPQRAYLEKLRQHHSQYVQVSINGPPPLKPIPTPPDVPDDRSLNLPLSFGLSIRTPSVKTSNVSCNVGSVSKGNSNKGPFIPPITTPPDSDSNGNARKRLLEVSHYKGMDTKSMLLKSIISADPFPTLPNKKPAWRPSCVYRSSRSRMR